MLISDSAVLLQDYSLIIVGHSLGAGVATALGLILREHFPNLRCYTYSPIGCAFNFPVMEYTKEFVISFIIGKDMIPRFVDPYSYLLYSN